MNEENDDNLLRIDPSKTPAPPIINDTSNRPSSAVPTDDRAGSALQDDHRAGSGRN